MYIVTNIGQNVVISTYFERKCYNPVDGLVPVTVLVTVIGGIGVPIWGCECVVVKCGGKVL